MAKATETTNKEAQTVDVDAMVKAAEAKIAEMFKAAEARVDEMIKAAEEKTGKKSNLPELSKRLNDEGEEYVTIKLFKDNDKYNDDVFVAVNGEGCNIPRGIPQKIKRKFARNLELSDLQDAKTAQFMDEKANEFEAESKKRNI